jgi:pimeloyl-ACP methyl ester carboxylesterase
MVAGGFAPACDGSTPSPLEPARFDESVCPFVVHPSQIQGSTMRCGVLYTPEVHASPSRLIQVPVLIFKGSAPTSPPLVYLSGGPGQSWADMGLEQMTASRTQSFSMDLVFIEQRGTGLSTPRLDCAGLGEGDDFDLALVAACVSDLKGQGVNIAAYNLQEMAEDVATFQSVMGYPTIAIDGVSYGTAWGLELLRAHSATTSFAILDSVINPAIPMFSEHASATDGGFAAIFAACAADSACASSYGDLKAKMVAALGALESRPLTLVQTGAPYDDHAMFWDAVAAVAFGPELFPRMLDEVAAAIAGGAGQLLYDSSLSNILGLDAQALSHSAIGQRASVLCADNQLVTVEETESDLSTVTPAFRPYLDQSTSVEGCQAWPYQHRTALDYAPVSSAVPTLLLSGVLDPLTSPDWARRASSTLSQSYWVALPGVGHGASSSSSQCARSLVSKFVASPGPPDTTCVQSMKITFAGPAKPSPRVVSGDGTAKGEGLTARARVARLFQRRSIERRMAALLGD